MTALLIRDVSLVDVVQGRVDAPRSVVIEDGLIRDIVAQAPSWSGPSLDGSGRYLAPGLIDAHVHCFLNASGTPRLDYLAASDEQHLAVGRHNLGVAIRAGITTVRDVGAPAALMGQLQAEVAAGHVVGPHLVSSGQRSAARKVIATSSAVRWPRRPRYGRGSSSRLRVALAG